MNDLIRKNQLKQLITRTSGCDPVFVDLFLDQMLAIITEQLSKGEEVHIEGLGIFKMVTFERGARMRPVFIPDESFREGINAPFAQFEPFQIVPPQRSRAVIPPDAKEHNSQPLVNMEETAVSDNSLFIESDMEKNPEKQGKEESSASQKEAEDKLYRDEMSEVEDPVEISDGNGNLSENVEKVVEESTDESPASCKGPECSTSAQLSSGKTGIWFAIVLLAVCILGAVIYFVVRVDKAKNEPAPLQNTTEVTIVDPLTLPTDADTIPQALIPVQETPAPDSLPAKQDLQTHQINEESAASADKPIPADSDAPLAVVKLKRGERLTLLALRYYGNKAFWVYIFEANKRHYVSPDLIPAGATLIIPNPSVYNIDKNNTASLKKARELGSRILTESR